MKSNPAAHHAYMPQQTKPPEGSCCYAVAIGRSTPHNRNQTLAEPLDVLAACLHHLGRTGEAIACWQEAVAIYADTGYLHHAAEVRQRIHAAQAAPWLGAASG